MLKLDKYRIMCRCADLGLSEGELAGRLGITPQNCSNLLKCSSPVRPATVTRLCQALECKAADITKDEADAKG